MDSGTDLLNIIHTYEFEASTKLWFGFVIATVSFVLIYVIVAIAWGVVRKPPFGPGVTLRRLVASHTFWLYIGVVLALQFSIAWIAWQRLVPRERFLFVSTPALHSFVTLAIFTSVPDRITLGQNGIIKIFARAYFSELPGSLLAVAATARSKWLNLAWVSDDSITNSSYGKTTGTTALYEYNPNVLGTHAIKEQFDVVVRAPASTARRKTPQQISYYAYNVESVEVVQPFSIDTIVTNTVLWQTLGALLPAALAVLGLSRKRQAT
jgi:hypothetical protein